MPLPLCPSYNGSHDEARSLEGRDWGIGSIEDLGGCKVTVISHFSRYDEGSKHLDGFPLRFSCDAPNDLGT